MLLCSCSPFLTAEVGILLIVLFGCISKYVTSSKSQFVIYGIKYQEGLKDIMEDVVVGGDGWILLPNRKHLVNVFSNLCQPTTHSHPSQEDVCVSV